MKRRWGILLACVSMLALANSSSYAESPFEKPARPVEACHPARISQVLQLYMADKQPDAWWFTSAEIQGSEEIDQFIRRADTIVSSITTALNRHKKLSPLAGAIAARFTGFRVSVFNRGGSIWFSHDDEGTAQKLEVCFYARPYAPAMPATAYYRREWGALMLAGMEWPDRVFPAIVLHELGHAHYAVEGRVSATAPPWSDEYADEEIAMHELEADVLNAESGGAYFREIDMTTARHPVSHFYDALLTLTADDLKALDASVGATHAGAGVSGVLVAQHLTAVGLRYINARTKDETEKLRLKRELYRRVSAALAGG